ncbi:ABC transporter permease [Streptomyces sp. NPDC093589]|uniref:ABC transporter permease n=1 Tax=Streptomyces sp. NPDC093589 TaxID=3366043 RepID=UPI003829C133
MTAPLTPRNNQPPEEPQNPWAAPAAGRGAAADPGALPSHGRTPARAYFEDPEHVREVREAAVIALAVAVSGVLLGVLWPWLAPHVPLIADTKSIYLKNTEGEESIGADGTFVLLALGFGVLSAAVVFLFRRRGGIPLVVALTAGGLLGAVLAWHVGVWLGPTENVIAHAKQVGTGVTFDSPLRLEAKGALLAWPVAAMLAQLALTGLFGPRDPEPEAMEWPGNPPQDPPNPH